MQYLTNHCLESLALHQKMEFFLAILWPFVLSGHGLAINSCVKTFYVQNQCPYPIWPATASNVGQPVIAEGGFYLASGTTTAISAPLTWSGRIWARTGCNFESDCSPGCDTGDCGGRLACDGLIGTPPATLVQFALSGNTRKPDVYDVSVVDGFNIPVIVSDRQSTPKCTIGGCTKNLTTLCPPELQVLNTTTGLVVACKSACLAFDLDSYCCRNEYGTPGKCKPSSYSKVFRDACPTYHSYAYDTAAPSVTCSSNEYLISFCPALGSTAAAYSPDEL